MPPAKNGDDRKGRRHGERRSAGNALDLKQASSPLRVLQLPLALTFGLLLVSFVPRVQVNLVLTWSCWGSVLALVAWQAVLFKRLKNAGHALSLQMNLRPQHYVQAMVQIGLFGYWGYYWRPVYDHAWLLVAQLLFAYSFDMLLSWSRREKYVLGFGPFPIILSINLFLWFRDDWFYMQFLMIAVGFMGKEYVRWRRQGKIVHIVNPSAFSLGLFSLVLIATNTTSLTWGQEIASTLTLAPHIYLFLFLIGLIVMYFFSITLVAATAAMTLFGFSAMYSVTMGVPYFLDSEIPAAVFLGLHLLITDPSTSPRTPSGRAIFGGMYGLGVVGLYSLLGAIGVPTFYDKLLCVPLLNASVIGIDRFVRSIRTEAVLNVWRENWFAGRANLAHMGVWILVFSTMTVLGKTDGKHTGDSLPFWEQACAENLPNACSRLLQLEATDCGDNSAWACNELGAYYKEGRITEPDSELALAYFSRSCELQFQSGCVNLLYPGTVSRGVPHALDLRLLLREGGQNLMQMQEQELYDRACDHNWSFACSGAVDSQ